MTRQVWPPTVGVYVLDFNKDGWMDVALTHAGAPGISLWRNVDGKRFERVPLPITDATRGWGITAIDFDNDGWIDLAAVVETAKGTELRVLRNKGAQGFEDVSASLGLDKLKLHDPRAVIAADLDNDLAADLRRHAIGRRSSCAAQRRRQQEPCAAHRPERPGRQQDWLGNEDRDLRQRLVAEVRSRGRRGLSQPGTAGNSRRAGQEHAMPTSCACCGPRACCRTKSMSR